MPGNEIVPRSPHGPTCRKGLRDFVFILLFAGTECLFPTFCCKILHFWTANHAVGRRIHHNESHDLHFPGDYSRHLFRGYPLRRECVSFADLGLSASHTRHHRSLRRMDAIFVFQRRRAQEDFLEQFLCLEELLEDSNHGICTVVCTLCVVYVRLENRQPDCRRRVHGRCALVHGIIGTAPFYQGEFLNID